MAKRKPGMPPKENQPKPIALIADGERFGVFDDRKVYNQYAIARIMGFVSTPGRCPQYVLHHLIKAGVPFAKLGTQYLVSGHQLHMWVQQRAKTWDEHFPDSMK